MCWPSLRHARPALCAPSPLVSREKDPERSAEPTKRHVFGRHEAPGGHCGARLTKLMRRDDVTVPDGSLPMRLTTENAAKRQRTRVDDFDAITGPRPGARKGQRRVGSKSPRPRRLVKSGAEGAHVVDRHVQRHFHGAHIARVLRQQIATLQRGQESRGKGLRFCLGGQDSTCTHSFQPVPQHCVPRGEGALDVQARSLVQVRQLGSQGAKGHP